MDSKILKIVLYHAWSATGVRPEEIDVDDDLFDDLNGHPADMEELFQDDLVDATDVLIPYCEIHGLRTVRKAVEVLDRYHADPKGEYGRCLERLNAALGREPGNIGLYRYRANLWWILLEWEQELRDIETCLRLDPGDEAAKYLRSRVLQTIERVEQGRREGRNIPAQVLELAGAALGKAPGSLDPDAALFNGVHPDFHERLHTIIALPIPAYDLRNIRTARQAENLLRRYEADPGEQYRWCGNRLGIRLAVEPGNQALRGYQEDFWRIAGKPKPAGRIVSLFNKVFSFFENKQQE